MCSLRENAACILYVSATKYQLNRHKSSAFYAMSILALNLRKIQCAVWILLFFSPDVVVSNAFVPLTFDNVNGTKAVFPAGLSIVPKAQVAAEGRADSF